MQLLVIVAMSVFGYFFLSPASVSKDFAEKIKDAIPTWKR